MLAPAGLLLAAGAGRRMGQPKALVELDGEPLVRRALRTLVEGGAVPVVVVLGAQADDVRAVLPADVAPYVAEMGRIGSSLARGAAEVIQTRDLTRAGQLEADDDAMDDLHRHLFTVLTAPSWDHGVAPAVDITLIGRFYERYADHAVALARRVVYIVTGRMPRPLVP